jgi:superfamily I DNA/RNA helicase
MTPSIKQQTVYDTWTTTDYNLLIQSVAGSGKTTTLMGILERCEYRTLFLAFNKSIQEEIQGKIEQNGYAHAKAMTIHSLGLLSIRNHYGSGNVIINNNKSWQLMKDLERFNKRLFGSLIWEERAKISMTIMEMNDLSRVFLTNDMKELFGFMKQMDKFYFEHPNLEQLWNEFITLREQTYTGSKIEIDFNDMIYLVVREKIMIAVQPYYLMIDEVQDLSFAQHQFIHLLVNQGDIEKWVKIGDRRQSIYGFSGAYGNSFDLIKEEPNVIEVALDVCYRCPQLVVDEANKVYNVMEGFKQEPGIVDNITDVSLIQEGSMVICRNSTPLIDLYFQLLSLNKKVFIKGDDILASITKFLKPYSYKTVDETKRKIASELTRLERIENKNDDERFKLYRLKQNYSNFILLITHLVIGDNKIEVLLQSLKQLFAETDDESVITLCTIHKSKGLEADVVYILNEFLIPSKFAKSPMQLEQEQNLKYVARTRAKKELYYLIIKSEDE